MLFSAALEASLKLVFICEAIAFVMADIKSIDPANGKILLSRELSGFEALMMLHQGMQGGGHDMSVMNNPDFNYGHPMMMNPGSNLGR